MLETGYQPREYYVAPEVRGTNTITIESQIYAVGKIMYGLFLEETKAKFPMEEIISQMCSEKPNERPKLSLLIGLEAPPLRMDEKLVVSLPGRQIQHY